MMGSRGCKGGAEYDAFSRYARRFLIYLHRPGVVKASKRKFWKRQRREAKESLRIGRFH